MADTVVPGVTTLMESDAVAAMQRARLTPNVQGRQYHDTIGDGRVISQSESVGATVAEWTVVDLVVSRGEAPAPHIDYTRYEGESRLSTVEHLEAHSRVIDEQVREHHSIIPYGHVIRVEPITPNRVKIVISDGPPSQERRFFRPRQEPTEVEIRAANVRHTGVVGWFEDWFKNG